MSYGAEQPLSEAGLRICRVVSEQPGIHFRGLARAAQLPAGQLRHHLDRLVRRGILVELEDGGYKRFFLAGKHDPRLRPALALFARRVPRRIGSLLLLRPMTRTELRRHLGCGDSTLGFHLARMVQAQVVSKQRDRSGCRYVLTEPELSRQALAMRAAAVGEDKAAAARDAAWAPDAPREGLLPPRRDGAEPVPAAMPAAAEGPAEPLGAAEDDDALPGHDDGEPVEAVPAEPPPPQRRDGAADPADVAEVPEAR